MAGAKYLSAKNSKKYLREKFPPFKLIRVGGLDTPWTGITLRLSSNDLACAKINNVFEFISPITIF